MADEANREVVVLAKTWEEVTAVLNAQKKGATNPEHYTHYDEIKAYVTADAVRKRFGKTGQARISDTQFSEHIQAVLGNIFLSLPEDRQCEDPANAFEAVVARAMTRYEAWWADGALDCCLAFLWYPHQNATVGDLPREVWCVDDEAWFLYGMYGGAKDSKLQPRVVPVICDVPMDEEDLLRVVNDGQAQWRPNESVLDVKQALYNTMTGRGEQGEVGCDSLFAGSFLRRFQASVLAYTLAAGTSTIAQHQPKRGILAYINIALGHLQRSPSVFNYLLHFTRMTDDLALGVEEPPSFAVDTILIRELVQDPRVREVLRAHTDLWRRLCAFHVVDDDQTKEEDEG